MIEITKIFFEMLTGILALTGFAFCIYYIFFRKKLYIKGFLILDMDESGEQLEYHVRRINANIKIESIILYSKSGSPEAENICRLLSRDYPNIKFYGGAINLGAHEVDKCGE